MKKLTIFYLFILLLISISIFYYNLSIMNSTNNSNQSENENVVLNQEVDKIVVYKSKREMLVYNSDNLLKTYKIALGNTTIGHKQFEGDGKTPEGVYTINDKNPNSTYHKNLGVSYPNESDIEYAKSHNKSAGGDIKIHGLRNGFGAIGRLHLNSDWTLGCIAVTNEEIDELFEYVKIGSPIIINP